MPPSSPVHSSQPPPVGWRSTGQQDFTRLDELQAAQAQSAQLRALHAAVLKNTRSPSKLRSSPSKSRPQRCPSPSSTSSAARYRQDYPVFTPSYEDFVLRGRMQADHNRRNSIDWEAHREAKDGRGLETSSSSGLGATDILSYVRGTDDSPPSAKAVSEAFAKCSANPFRESSVHMGSIPPHHITSIHPIRGSEGKKIKSQNKGTTDLKLADLTRRKKLLSEFLNEEARKKAFMEATEAASRKKPPMTEVGPDAGLSCDRCRPGPLGSNVTVVPLTDSRDFRDIPPKERNFTDFAGPKDRTGNNNPFRSWFSKVKKKPTSVPTTAQSAQSTVSSGKETVNPEAAKDILEIGMAMDSMELKVSQANKKRDAALEEVMELRLAMGEMEEKLEYLEQSCQSLKHALERRMVWQDEGPEEGAEEYYARQQEARRRVQASSSASPLPSPRVKATKSEFIHAVTEARVGVKQLSRTLVQEIQERSGQAKEKMERIVGGSYKVRGTAGRVSRSAGYQVEAVMNKVLYEDFENVKFERNGSYGILDGRERAMEMYREYGKMARARWSEAVSKESRSYSQSFDGFCASKMEALEQVVQWQGSWPLGLAQAFFHAARSVWIVHLLAFALHPLPAAIFRVAPQTPFHPTYMDLLPSDHHHHHLLEHQQEQEQEQEHHHEPPLHQHAAFDAMPCQPPSNMQPQQQPKKKKHDPIPTVRLMVMPGFFLLNDLVKCKVLCNNLHT